jgi:methylglutaconyl-CoA hydratase
MTNYQTLLIDIKDQVATVTLNRPDVHNAFNDILILELIQAFTELGKDPDLRVIVLTGAAPSFCAGGDLNWMKKSASYSREQNIEDAKKLHEMLFTIYRCPKPVIAKVNGATLGGGMGLLAATDIAVAYKTAMFGLSEVRVGLIPAVISPFVIRKIGAARFRELTLTAERLSAMQAKEIGLISQSGDPEQIDEVVEVKIKALKAAGPEALAESKKLVEEVAHLDLDKAAEITARYLAERRASPEGQEGIDAFLNKRKPKWMT